MYNLSTMAKKLNVSKSTLRNWDKSKKLVANRTPTNRMFYTHDQYLETSGKSKYKCTGSDIDAVRDKVVLITGGTGSLGHALSRRICDVAKKVIIYSRCELKQANMKQKFADKKNMRYMIGDIRDKERLTHAMKGVDICIHAACMKRVETCTYNPLEAVKSNVIGSMNVLEASIENKVHKTLLVSSDKACLDRNSVVELSDGTTKKISDIVLNKENVYVKSYDEKTNTIVNAKVTGWFKNKIGDRKMYSVSYKNSKWHGKNKTRALATEDHLFFTKESGWKESSCLRPGELIATGEPSPNKNHISLLCGILLGDGNILNRSKRTRGIVRYGQAKTNYKWVEMIHDSLSELNPGKISIAKQSHRNRQDFYGFNLPAYGFVNEIFGKFYSGGKKVIPRLLIKEYYSEIMLAAWLVDDGMLDGKNARIATHSFTWEDVMWLSEFLGSKGIDNRVYPAKVDGNIYPELRVTVKGTSVLHKLIAPYLPESCQYKIIPKYHDLFDIKNWNLGKADVFFDEVVVKKVKYNSADVYCLEVEGTNNFIVSGVVVHNCAPATLYGGTKFVAEQLFINGNNYATRDCLFTATRYGNVYASNGSVRHLFERQAKEEGKVKVTHEDMTRFFMSMDDAVDLNLFALNNTIGGEIFIPKLKGTTIMAFAETFAPGVPVEFIGLRGYEKIHEDLISPTEMLYVVDCCYQYYKIVPPGVTDWTLGWDISYPDEPRVEPFEYASDTVEQFTPDELKEFDK